MDFTLSVTRKLDKATNNIIEVFTWDPKHKFVNDSKRKIYHLIRNEINKLSIHKKGFKLIDIKYLEEKIIYVYEYNSIIVDLCEQKKIKYIPTLGTKYCKKCLNYKIYKGIGYCVMKGIKVKKKSYYKCNYWTELGDNRVYKQRRPKGDGAVNERVSSSLKRGYCTK